METLIFSCVTLAALCLIWIAFVFWYAERKYLTNNNDTTTLKPMYKPSKNIKSNDLYGYSHSNEKQNFQKKQQKARNQGKLQFYFHGEYYPTGLLVVNGGK